jgi:HD-GYP domain-containing protein (c-di-GMP phosphodiesterase class II)
VSALRARLTARAYVAATVTVGTVVVAAAAARAVALPLQIAPLALLAAAVVVAELFAVSADAESLDPADAQTFSFSSGIHVAAVLIVGPVGAALLAAGGVLAVDRLRGQRWTQVLFNAAGFAISAAAAGGVYELAGGAPGSLRLPHDLLPLAALLVTYRAANLGLVSGVICISTGAEFLPLVRAELRTELAASLAESGLAIAVAFVAFDNGWLALPLAPLAFAVYQSHARLALLRRETLHALETFANVVDERDPYTYRHSERVADHVRQLAQRVGLPAAQTVRLRLAARVHDLGKIAVDGAILSKPGQLDTDEWTVMRRHARLSARLLRRFRFAAEEAQAVEYHHERYDGDGYYGIERDEIPLGAHFLIVADSFDAMTSDRPYRDALTEEEALARIEAGAGTQFHPAVAKAFVAMRRGLDPRRVLDPTERRALVHRPLLVRASPLAALRRVDDVARAAAFTAMITGLVLVGFHRDLAAICAFAFAAAALVLRALEDVRGRRCGAALRRAVDQRAPREALFHGLVGCLAAGCGVRWAGLVSWRSGDLAGRVELESGDYDAAPTDTALVSWLLRETESRGELLVADGAELGSRGAYAALPLARDDDAAAFLVFGFKRTLSRSTRLGLLEARDAVAAAIADPARPHLASMPRPLAAVS